MTKKHSLYFSLKKRSLKILVRLTGPMVLSSKLNVKETETISSTLQRTGLDMVARIVQISGKVLRTHTTEAAQRDTPYLASYSSQILNEQNV